MSLIVTDAASFFTLVHTGQFRVEVKVAYTTRRRHSLSGAGKEIWDIVDLEIAYKNKRNAQKLREAQGAQEDGARKAAGERGKNAEVHDDDPHYVFMT